MRLTVGFDESVQVPAEFHQSGRPLPIAFMLGAAFAREMGQALIDNADAAEVKRSAESN